MHYFPIYSFLTLATASTALAGFEVLEGSSALGYCGLNPQPGHDNCLRAIAKIDDDADYSQGTEMQAGDCTVAIEYSLGSSSSVKGSAFKTMASSILEKGCKGDGWGFVEPGVNVTVHLCTICMYGTCTTCNAPARRSGATLPMLNEVREISPTPIPEHFSASRYIPTGEMPALQARDDEPEPFVRCGTTLGPVTSGDCKQLADSLRGKMLTLPYIASQGGCELALFAHNRGEQAIGDMVADRISHDTDLCDSYGYVGAQEDALMTLNIFGVGPVIWFGQLCGRFSFGMDGCTP